MAAFTTNLTLSAGSFVRNAELDENVSIAGMRTRGNSLATLVAGVDTTLSGDQHATIKDDAMVYDMTINGVNRLRFSGFTTFELGEGNDVLNLTVRPANAASAWTTAVAANGGNGDDTIWSGSGNDTLTGEAGIDRIWGGNGNDRISGGDDADILRGSAGNDIVFGDFGDDRIFGGSGEDLIYGGANDGFVVNVDNPFFPGFGLGSTEINGGDVLQGGDGQDIFVWRAGDGVQAITDFDASGDRLAIEAHPELPDLFQPNHAGFFFEETPYPQGLSTVVTPQTYSQPTIVVLGVQPSELTPLGTQTIDGVTYNLYG